MKSQYSDFLLASDEVLSIENQKAELPLRIATSENAFIIEGWVSSDNYDKVVSTVNSATSGRAYVTSLEIEEEEEEEGHVPVEYNNSKPVAPMQEIMDLILQTQIHRNRSLFNSLYYVPLDIRDDSRRYGIRNYSGSNGTGD